MAANTPGMFSARRGGVWRAAKPIYSKETVEMLEVLMTESRLTLMMRQQLRDSLKSGATQLPLCLRSRSASPNVHVPSPPVSAGSDGSRGIRSRESIVKSGVYERQRFQPCNTKSKNPQEAKERLQNIMEFGQESSPAHPPSSIKSLHSRISNGSTEPNQEDIFKQLAAEIDARRDFLERMKEMGLGEKYRFIINAEISQRLRELQMIDNESDDVQQQS